MRPQNIETSSPNTTTLASAMTEPIEKFITFKLDGKQKKDDVQFAKKRFKEFVQQPKYKDIYEKQTDGWRQLIRPIVEKNCTAIDLLEYKFGTEEEFWNSLVELEATTHTSLVSAGKPYAKGSFSPP